MRLPHSVPYSHPKDEGGPQLRDHLDEVSTWATNLVSETATTPDGYLLSDVTAVAGRCHDLGKATSWFQLYLHGKRPSDAKTMHSPLGALATAYSLRARGASPEDALIGLTTVARHHGDLPNVVDYTLETVVEDRGRRRLVREQVANIDTVAQATAETVIHDATAGEGSWAEFRMAIERESLYDTLEAQLTNGLVKDVNACSNSFYDAVLQSWSALVVADKSSAAALPEPGQRATHQPSTAVEEHIDRFETATNTDKEARLNEYRNQARRAAVGDASQLATHQGGVASLTLPTGLGKTLTGLQAAGTIRESQASEGRIIYVLPYTSIVDQTVETVKEVFGVDEYGDALTVHHHLAETATRVGDDATTTAGTDTDAFAREEYLLGETWQTGIVVTTYVQLFESLVTPSNGQSLKLPSLHESVIILDEPQSLPLDWWRLVRRVTATLVEEYRASIVSMTATQPHLFDDNGFDDRFEFDVTELVADPRQYFEAFSRVGYRLAASMQRFLAEGANARPCTHTDAAAELASTVVSADTSALAICNTVASAQALSDAVSTWAADNEYEEVTLGAVYEELLAKETTAATNVSETADALANRVQRAVAAQDDAVVTLHATTRHRPRDRRVLLAAAKTLATDATDDSPFVFVSTQLVEAGVDVSFERVYRDVAPLPSIVQAAGRCNRSFEWDHGTVTLWRLAAPDERWGLPSAAVYARDGHNLLDVTRVALASVCADSNGPPTDPISDTALAQRGVEAYYDELITRQPGNREYPQWVDDALFGKLRAELEYISEASAQVEVIVCRSEADLAAVDRYTTLRANDEFEKASRVLNELQDCVVSLPIHDEETATTLRASLDRVSAGHGDYFVLDTREPTARYSATYGASVIGRE